MDRIDTNASTTRRTAARGRAPAILRAAAAAALAAGALLAPAAANAQSADPWFGQDKVKHFSVSAPLGMVGTSMIPARASMAERIAYGTLIGSLPGLAKELSDIGRPGSTPSMKDMAFNVLGAALGATLADCCLIRPFASGDRIDGVGIEYRIPF